MASRWEIQIKPCISRGAKWICLFRFVLFFARLLLFTSCQKFVSEVHCCSDNICPELAAEVPRRKRRLRNNVAVYSSFLLDLLLKQPLLAKRCNTVSADEVKMYFNVLHTLLLSKQHYCTLATSRTYASYPNNLFLLKLCCFMAQLPWVYRGLRQHLGLTGISAVTNSCQLPAGVA